MKSNYKSIGQFIQSIDDRNIADSKANLLGVSVSKVFIKSIANTIGTDFTNYKIVRKNQFTYIPDTSRRGDKIGIALLDDEESGLVSPVYTVFEVTNTEQLLPVYLMMWFRRPEFDRYARFISHGSVREVFSWEDLCNVSLPIPSPEKQREIVKEYNTIVNRIKLNEQLCQKLEETAQAVYKQWFVDFEFPDENGNPYKSSGGEMVFCKELEKDVPVGWEIVPFTGQVKLSGGGTPDTNNESFWNGNIPFFTPADISNSYYSINTEKYITDVGLGSSSTKLYPKNTIFITARGTVGAIGLSAREMAMNQSCYAIKSKTPFYSHQLTIDVVRRLKKEAVGAVFGALVTKDFDGQNSIMPTKKNINVFEKLVGPIYELNLVKCLEIKLLSDFKNILLSKLATIEN